jgi:hypothetical protein
MPITPCPGGPQLTWRVQVERANATQASYWISVTNLTSSTVRTGVQWRATIPARATQRWFTFGWNAASHVVWYMMPTSPQPGTPELDWQVAVERANPAQCTYWITVMNLTGNPVAFEGRYAMLT